jgi:hypothetical protein
VSEGHVEDGRLESWQKVEQHKDPSSSGERE